MEGMKNTMNASLRIAYLAIRTTDLADKKHDS
jgi:hypothetical protein